MKKFLLLFILLIIPFGVKAHSCIPDDVSTSGYSFELEFVKGAYKAIVKGEEESLKGAEFIVTSLDKRYTFASTQSFENEMYKIIGGNQTPTSVLYNILPSNIKTIYDSINTLSDFDTVLNNTDFTYLDLSCVMWCEDENTCHDNKTRLITFLLPVRLVETKTPIGYKKGDFVFTLEVGIYFNYKDGEENIDNKQIKIYIPQRRSNSIYFYEYNDQENYYDHVTSYHSVETYIGEHYYGNDNYIYNYATPAELKIENFIEGKTTYDTTSDTVVSYRIVVSNEGGQTSESNIVRISIPKKLEVDESSISNNGMYDEETNEIIWTFNELGGFSSIELYFDIIVPKDVNGEYKIGSSVSNSITTVTANKNKLKVSDPVSNPNTGDNDAVFIILMLLVISSMSLVYVNKKYILIN